MVVILELDKRKACMSINVESRLEEKPRDWEKRENFARTGRRGRGQGVLSLLLCHPLSRAYPVQ